MGGEQEAVAELVVMSASGSRRASQGFLGRLLMLSVIAAKPGQECR